MTSLCLVIAVLLVLLTAVRACLSQYRRSTAPRARITRATDLANHVHWVFIPVLDELLTVTAANKYTRERHNETQAETQADTQSQTEAQVQCPAMSYSRSQRRRRCAHCRHSIINRAIDISVDGRRFCSLDCRSSNALTRSFDLECHKLLACKPLVVASSCAATLPSSASSSASRGLEA